MPHLTRLLACSALILATLVASTQQTSHDATTTRHRETASPALFAELEELARLVAISYCVGFQGIQKPFTCMNHCSEFPGLQLVQTWDTGLITNSCGYIALAHDPDYPPRILVIFRGTSSVANFVADLQTTHAEYVPYTTSGGEKCTNCTVHSGFMRGWNATREAVLPQLKVLRSQYPDYPIVLAGHSLGGATAGIAGMELSSDREFWGDVKVVTFGEPMFGNKGMARFVDARFGCNGTTAADEACSYHRVTHVGDPVPLMPPREWGWRPHGGEIFVSKADLPPQREDIVICSGAEDEMCIAGGDHDAAAAIAELSAERPFEEPEDATSDRVLAARGLINVPPRWRIWQLLFAHREYIWRLGLCFDPGWPWDSEPGLVEVVDSDEL